MANGKKVVTNALMTALLAKQSETPEGDNGRNGGGEGNDANAAAFKVVMIDVGEIMPSADNFYGVDDIADLKASILAVGLKQNLVVKESNKEVAAVKSGEPRGGRLGYECVAGHRRLKACTELADEGHNGFRAVPCVIERGGDALLNRLSLILTNSTARVLTDWERVKQSEELRTLITELKNREGLPGRVRDYVAEAMGVSATQAARMQAISEKLTPALELLFKDGKIGMSVAAELAALDSEGQRQASNHYGATGALTLEHVRKIRDKRDVGDDEAKRRDKAADALTRHIHYHQRQDCKLGGTYAKCGNALNIASFYQNDCLTGCAGCCATCPKRRECVKVCKRVKESGLADPPPKSATTATVAEATAKGYNHADDGLSEFDATTDYEDDYDDGGDGETDESDGGDDYEGGTGAGKMETDRNGARRGAVSAADALVERAESESDGADGKPEADDVFGEGGSHGHEVNDLSVGTETERGATSGYSKETGRSEIKTDGDEANEPPQLLPCPFCGGDMLKDGYPLSAVFYEEDGLKAVRCKYCGARTAAAQRKEYALAFWNRRAEI